MDVATVLWGAKNPPTGVELCSESKKPPVDHTGPVWVCKILPPPGTHTVDHYCESRYWIRLHGKLNKVKVGLQAFLLLKRNKIEFKCQAFESRQWDVHRVPRDWTLKASLCVHRCRFHPGTAGDTSTPQYLEHVRFYPPNKKKQQQKQQRTFILTNASTEVGGGSLRPQKQRLESAITWKEEGPSTRGW